MPPFEHIQEYFSELQAIHGTGAAVKETSYYPCLSSLFNSLGKKLKPKVRCIIHPRSIGAGIPDGALFTSDQKSATDDPLAEGLAPSRGVIEVKGPGENLSGIVGDSQITKYLQKYGLVLLTNYRDFLLLRWERGAVTRLEQFTIAATEKEFWHCVSNPQALNEEIGAQFHEYLNRVLMHAAPLLTPKEVAWFLASYARQAKVRLEQGSSLPSLGSLRSALEEALGLKFTGPEGEHFFRSSLVQTLFYGVFSAWVLWCKRAHPSPQTKFNWHEAAWSLHVPMIKTLFEHVATPTKLHALGLEELLDWTGEALNRVDRQSFFENFEEDDAVQYFYEPFLAAYDPLLRKRLGVWFTPKEVVRYIVARVDQVLRDDLALPDGLADPNVIVLDPCCGTGAFLVEVLRSIEATLRGNGGDALLADDVKHAAIERVFGFELLPAPFVVAHLQMGLLLQNLGAPLSEKTQERVGVYLTNALTGWNPPKGPKQKLIFPELEEERDAADLVKRDKRILVVLGNPPYYAFSGVSPQEEQGLVEVYKQGLAKQWKIRKFNLDELYVRFLRLGERRIAEMSGTGVLAYISSYSYVTDPSFVVVRQRLAGSFDRIWIDSLNGDSRETGKVAPNGRPDPSVFSTEYNKEGIRLGTAIGVFAKTGPSQGIATVSYRDFWEADKREKLLDSLHTGEPQYVPVAADEANRFSFRPSVRSSDYEDWASPLDLAELEPVSGLQEMRRGALMSMDVASLSDRLIKYLDHGLAFGEVAPLVGGLAKRAGGFDPEQARSKILAAEVFGQDQVQRYALYPLDNRWCYYSAAQGLWNRARPELVRRRPAGEPLLVIRRFAERPKEGHPTTVTSALPDYHLLRPNVVAIPMTILKPGATSVFPSAQGSIFDQDHEGPMPIPNLSSRARRYLASLGRTHLDDDLEAARDIWFHYLAVNYSPLYLHEHEQGIRADLPRVPLPAVVDRLRASSSLGRTLALLLDVEKDVIGVTTGKLRRELSILGRLTESGSGVSLCVSCGWGSLQPKNGIVMPGKGNSRLRSFSSDEIGSLREGGSELSFKPEDLSSLLGPRTVDVYLNGSTYWSNVPEAVWNYKIGGYQVLKKWLSYREHSVLCRDITKDEAREFTHMVRRIAALLMIEPALDENYKQSRHAAAAWRSF